ncbi:DUF2752 domain-containing protein [Saccharopolyspora sp. NPDC000359]|uniref:DUF2752 domain-containing protein n=1 Tax=Saccharopolyspora sp. NPDC000359 TaxID=3154251 RepID=UPI003326A17F
MRSARTRSPLRLRWTASAVAATAALGLLLGSGVLAVECPVRAAFGVDCPGCGGSRVIADLARGDLVAAVDHNAFAVLVLVPLALVLLVAGARLELGKARRMWPPGRWGKVVAVALGASVIAWTVLRNLPFPPFEALRA